MCTPSSCRACRVLGILFCLAILILPLSNPVSGQAVSPVDELRIDLPQPTVTVTVDASGLAHFTGEQLLYLSQSGEPALPYQVITILLPPNANPASVSVTLAQPRLSPVAGAWHVAPVPPATTWDGEQMITRWPPGKTIVDGRDVAIYQSDVFFPATISGRADAGAFRQWLLVDLPVALYRYNPVSRQLLQVTGGELIVHYTRQSATMPVESPTLADAVGFGWGETLLRERVTNYAQAAALYAQPAPAAQPAGQTSQYVIITTNAINTQSQQLAAFVNSKEERGLTVRVVTENEWGGGQGDAAAERIRHWLRANYQRLQIEYVLLIGNPAPNSGDVPMKTLWPRWPDQNADSPSDIYYTDLTGNWDRDRDGFYGELWDDTGPGGADRYWEILVGRIPYYGSISDLDRILAKTVNYENMPQRAATWRKNALLAMVPSDSYTPGYPLGEQIKDRVIAPQSDWGYYRLYAETYGLYPPPEKVPVTVDNVTDVWRASPFGAIFWWTHGWSQGASAVMDIWHVPMLNDQYPGFTFQASCTNAYPEDAQNLAYSLLRNGAIGTVAATRLSWYYPGETDFVGGTSNASMTYTFADYLIDWRTTASYALQLNKLDIWPGIWMNLTVFNLYGDPSLGIDTAPLGRTLSLSSSSDGLVDGMRFADEDILAYNMASGDWKLIFDGSDVGLAVPGLDVDAFAWTADDALLLSFNKLVTLPNVGWVDDADIVKFTPTALGRQTAGRFTLYFDGSDVGLTTASENIDALALTRNGDIVISTLGNFAVPTLSGNDRELLRFHATSLGANTQGTWARYFQGVPVGFNRSTEDLWGASISDQTGKLYLSTMDNFSVPDLSGSNADVFLCKPAQLGDNTACQFFNFWRGNLHSFAQEQIDGIEVGWLPDLALFAVNSAAVPEDVASSGDGDATTNEDVADDDAHEDQRYELFLPLLSKD